jgi:hypothetical protein
MGTLWLESSMPETVLASRPSTQIPKEESQLEPKARSNVLRSPGKNFSQFWGTKF